MKMPKGKAHITAIAKYSTAFPPPREKPMSSIP
jgi:hypothetical protein